MNRLIHLNEFHHLINEFLLTPRDIIPWHTTCKSNYRYRFNIRLDYTENYDLILLYINLFNFVDEICLYPYNYHMHMNMSEKCKYIHHILDNCKNMDKICFNFNYAGLINDWLILQCIKKSITSFVNLTVLYIDLEFLEPWRGNRYEICLSDKIFECVPNLVQLHFSSVRISNNKYLQYLPRLRYLTLPFICCDDDHEDMLESEVLKYCNPDLIYLECRKSSTFSGVNLQYVPNLLCLVSKIKLEIVILPKYLQYVPKLIYLEGVFDITDQILQGLPNLVYLYNEIMNENKITITGLKQLKQLEILECDIYCNINQITGLEDTSITYIINTDWTFVKKDGMFTCFEHCSHYKSIYLIENKQVKNEQIKNILDTLYKPWFNYRIK